MEVHRSNRTGCQSSFPCILTVVGILGRSTPLIMQLLFVTTPLTSPIEWEKISIYTCPAVMRIFWGILAGRTASMQVDWVHVQLLNRPGLQKLVFRLLVSFNLGLIHGKSNHQFNSIFSFEGRTTFHTLED